jgi:hypothetical protein
VEFPATLLLFFGGTTVGMAFSLAIITIGNIHRDYEDRK